MNVERLHLILSETNEAVNAGKIVETVRSLRDALQNQVDDPNDATHQQEVSRNLSALREILSQMPTNSFSPAWKEVLDGYGLWTFIDTEVLGYINEIFSRNSITPSLALNDVNSFYDEMSEDQKALSRLILSLERFGIAEEDLDPGEAELGILIPRQSIDSELGQFIHELADVGKIVKVFEELTTGERRDPHIKSLASSDLTVLLDMWPVSGAALAASIERIAAFYKQILEIKKLKLEAKRLELGPKVGEQLEKEAAQKMEANLDQLHAEIIKKFKGDKSRKHELSNELAIALRKIANKIDRGVHFEFRAAEAIEEDGEEASKQSKSNAGHAKEINDINRRLFFPERAEGRILQLPEGDGGESRQEKADSAQQGNKGKS